MAAVIRAAPQLTAAGAQIVLRAAVAHADKMKVTIPTTQHVL
jgi:hypothetical protein